MERMINGTQQYIEQLENMVRDLREKKLGLEEENKELKEINKSQNEEIQRFKDNAMADMTEITRLELENKKLKHENKYRAGIVDILPKGKGHIAEETIKDLQEENKKLKEELKKYKKLHKYSNGELLTYSGD